MDIPALLAQYLRAHPSERAALVSNHSSLFSSDLTAALHEAHVMLTQTQKEAKDACNTIDNVMTNMDIPLAPRLTSKEMHDLSLTQEEMIERFSHQLAALLCQEKKLDLGVQSTGLTQTSDVHGIHTLYWYQQSPLVLEIISFLPVQYIFNVVENVCKQWQEWLYVPSISRAFWAGCVQREFPETLRILLQSEGTDLYNTDWRTIAMICCTEDSEDDDNDNGNSNKLLSNEDEVS